MPDGNRAAVGEAGDSWKCDCPCTCEAVDMLRMVASMPLRRFFRSFSEAKSEFEKILTMTMRMPSHTKFCIVFIVMSCTIVLILLRIPVPSMNATILSSILSVDLKPVRLRHSAIARAEALIMSLPTMTGETRRDLCPEPCLEFEEHGHAEDVDHDRDHERETDD